MKRYTMELSSPAEKMYRRICEHARGCIELGDVSNPKVAVLGVVDELIDKTIPNNPFEAGRELSHPLTRVFWVYRERLHVFYVASPKPQTIAILSIWDTPKNDAHLRQADVILKHLVLTGQLDHVLAQYGLRSVSEGIRVRLAVVH